MLTTSCVAAREFLIKQLQQERDYGQVPEVQRDPRVGWPDAGGWTMTDDTAAHRARVAAGNEGFYDHGGKKSPGAMAEENSAYPTMGDAGFGHHNVFEQTALEKSLSAQSANKLMEYCIGAVTFLRTCGFTPERIADGADIPIELVNTMLDN